MFIIILIYISGHRIFSTDTHNFTNNLRKCKYVKVKTRNYTYACVIIKKGDPELPESNPTPWEPPLNALDLGGNFGGELGGGNLGKTRDGPGGALGAKR